MRQMISVPPDYSLPSKGVISRGISAIIEPKLTPERRLEAFQLARAAINETHALVIQLLKKDECPQRELKRLVLDDKRTVRDILSDILVYRQYYYGILIDWPKPKKVFPSLHLEKEVRQNMIQSLSQDPIIFLERCETINSIFVAELISHEHLFVAENSPENPLENFRFSNRKETQIPYFPAMVLNDLCRLGWVYRVVWERLLFGIWDARSQCYRFSKEPTELRDKRFPQRRSKGTQLRRKTSNG